MKIKKAGILSEFQPIILVSGGEREIRTLDTGFPVYSLSRHEIIKIMIFNVSESAIIKVLENLYGYDRFKKRLM